jgi:hypothetical protein
MITVADMLKLSIFAALSAILPVILAQQCGGKDLMKCDPGIFSNPFKVMDKNKQFYDSS